MKKVFISYSRKNDQDIFEFRSQEKNREFEILIDDEDLKFDAPWKQSIIKKITEADAAILFISNDALKPESPIRTLELPLIAKRIRDENDNFIFFPIFLEEVDKETLENYEFTIDGTNEKVNFLDFFQVLDITKQNKLKEARRRARNNFFRDINGNISASLKGTGLFSNVLEVSRIRQKQRAQNVGIVFAIMLSLFLFTRTDSFAKVIINAAERLQPEDDQEGNNVLFNALADQLNNIDNLEELGADDSLIEAIEEVQDLNLDLDLNLDDLAIQNTEDFNAAISEESTTTVAPTTTTVPWSPPADSYESIIDGTYEDICRTLGWGECGRWTIYDASGNEQNRVVGPYPLSALQAMGCQTSNVNICGGTPTGYAVLTGRYYPDESVEESFSYSFSLRCDFDGSAYAVGPTITTVGGSAVVEWYTVNGNGGFTSPTQSFYVDANSTSNRAIVWGADQKPNIFYRVGQTLSDAQSQSFSSSGEVDLSLGCP